MRGTGVSSRPLVGETHKGCQDHHASCNIPDVFFSFGCHALWLWLWPVKLNVGQRAKRRCGHMSQRKKICRACACASSGKMRKDNEFSLILQPSRFVKGSHVSSLSPQPFHLVLKMCSGFSPFSTPCLCLPHLTPTMQSAS